MKLLKLFNEGIISKQEMGLLLMQGIEIITEMNIDTVEKIINNEETIEKIKEKLVVKPEDEMEELIRKYMEREQRKPVETLLDNEGNFVGYRYSVNEQIGSANYHDVHVRISSKEGYTFYGSLWYTVNERIRRINYQIDAKGNITFSQYVGRSYYRDIIALTQRVVSWFEKELASEEIVAEDELANLVDEAIKRVNSK